MQRRARLGLTAAVILVLGLPGSAEAPEVPGFAGAFRWSMEDPLFGGLSAIELGADGGTFVAMTDRGAWTRGRLIRDEAGRIAGVEAEPLQKMRATGEAPLKPSRSDSEGMALAGDGTIFVSFEGVARVLRYAAFGSAAENLPTPEAFRGLLKNSSLEALAILPDGSLVTVLEDTRGSEGPFPAFRFDGRNWARWGSLPREGAFLPVAADTGPDGRLYVLEREFLGIRGFAARVRAYDPGPQGPEGGRTVMQSPPGTHDNLEGLSVWRGADGRIRLTMISDDNFRFYQRTEIVEYVLGD
jgi:hypothetical protein